MFCYDTRRERTEADLLRNLKLQSRDNPSSRNSILTSLVEDLCFWETDAVGGRYGNDGRINFGSETSRKHKQKGIPTMKEAMNMDKEYDSDNSETSPFQSATWKTAIDSNSGKVYYYDEVSKKAQWKKVWNTKSTPADGLTLYLS